MRQRKAKWMRNHLKEVMEIDWREKLYMQHKQTGQVRLYERCGRSVYKALKKIAKANK